jgi:hypothetical protein
MKTAFRTLRVVFALGGLAVLAPLGQERSRAQQAIPGSSGERVLEAKDLKGEERVTFNKLRDGNIDVAKEHKPILEKAAQWYVYRLTWPQHQRKALPDSTGMTENDLVNDCTRQIPDRTKMHPKGEARERQFGYIREYGKEITKAVEEVLKNPLPIARVNAARILAYLGKVGPEETGDAMVAVLEDKDQIDAVKLYALRGLKDLMVTVRDTTGKFKDPAREAKIINAIIEFMHREVKLPKEAKPEEQEAIRYVRREAVRALASVRAPAIVVKKQVVAQPALELMRVMSKDGFKPEPSSSERIEAALGLLQMQSSAYKPYQAEFVAQHIGYYLVDLATEYNTDRKNTGNMRAEPWKVMAAKFKLALDNFAAESKGNKNVEKIVTLSKPIFDSIEKDQIPSSVTLLRKFLGNYKPKGTTVYEGDEKSTVALPAELTQ